MPRVALSAEQRREYKLKDFKLWVHSQMRRCQMTQKDVGEALGLSQVRVSQMLDVRDKKKQDKKKDIDPFSYGQVLILCELFGADEEERQKLLML